MPISELTAATNVGQPPPPQPLRSWSLLPRPSGHPGWWGAPVSPWPNLSASLPSPPISWRGGVFHMEALRASSTGGGGRQRAGMCLPQRGGLILACPFLPWTQTLLPVTLGISSRLFCPSEALLLRPSRSPTIFLSLLWPRQLPTRAPGTTLLLAKGHDGSEGP